MRSNLMLYDRPSSPRKLADLLGSMIEIRDGVFERSLRAPLHTAEDVQSPDREPLESTEVV